MKHVERCVALMYVIDLSENQPWLQLQSLKYELEKFKPNLSRRPHAIIGNKYDNPDAETNLQELKKYIEENTPEGTLPLPVIPVSAKYGENIREFVDHMRGLYDLYQKEKEDNKEDFDW